MVFIRNDREGTAADAAAHMRSKLAAMRSEVQTLDDFIEKVASRSSTTGPPYQVKLPDGSVVSAEQWLRQQLERPPQNAGRAP